MRSGRWLRTKLRVPSYRWVPDEERATVRLIYPQMLIETEVDQGMSDEPESLMDRALMGLISSHRQYFICMLRETQLT